MSKFIVLDIVFYANSLNYDQGSGNIQELKKITKWDGKQYTLVSRYALRYSILHHAHSLYRENWSLAGAEQLNNNQGVVQAQGDAASLIRDFPEFDLFGYMMTETGAAANTRVATVTISHAVSLTPFSYDSHFNANLDVARRSGDPTSINPFTIEEHYTHYVYSIVLDLERVGAIDNGGEDRLLLDLPAKAERIKRLLNAVCTLKRQIKGRTEDLSPKLLFVGLYDNEPYQSFKDRIVLADEYQEECIQTEEPVANGTKIIRRIVKTSKPLFEIYGLAEKTPISKEGVIKQVVEFIREKKSDADVIVPATSQKKEKEDVSAKEPNVLFYKGDEMRVNFKKNDKNTSA